MTHPHDAAHAPHHPQRLRLMRFEHRHQALLSNRQFARRLLGHGAWAGILVAASMLLGTIGYHLLAGQSWVDSFLNAAMLLGGMGPVGDIATNAGKIFAALFALYAGLVFLAVAALLLAPVFHRVIHRFHFEADQQT